MFALLAAATLAAAPVAAPGSQDVLRTPNLYSVPAHCRDRRQSVVDKYGRPITRRLGDLPGAGPMLLVDRRIDGCPVITMMRGGTRTAPDQPNPPARQYRYLPLQPQK